MSERYDEYAERFRNRPVEELVDVFNREVGNPGWTTSRGAFLSALRDALLATGLDCSSFISGRSMSLDRRIRREGARLIVDDSRTRRA